MFPGQFVAVCTLLHREALSRTKYLGRKSSKLVSLENWSSQVFGNVLLLIGEFNNPRVNVGHDSTEMFPLVSVFLTNHTAALVEKV